MNYKRIRGGMGIGDAIYIQSIARHLVDQGEHLEICTSWPEVFTPIADRVQFAPFSRQNITYLAHYTQGKPHQNTTQFADMCRSCGIAVDIPLRLEWRPINQEIVRQYAGKKILIVQMPRAPMNRTDGFGYEILPDCRVIDDIIAQVKDQYFVIQVGKGEPIYRFKHLDLGPGEQNHVNGHAGYLLPGRGLPRVPVIYFTDGRIVR